MVQLFDRNANLAPPIGVLVHGAGKVGLLDRAERIVDLDGKEAARGRRQKAMDGDDNIVRHLVGFAVSGIWRQSLRAHESVEQTLAVLLAIPPPVPEPYAGSTTVTWP